MAKALFENLINSNRLSHAYFLEGGNEEFSLWLASRILCGGHDDDCITCRRINNHNHPDVIYIRPEGLEVKVNQIREINEKAAYKSVDGNGQVFIVQSADKMNLQASNAFLKFLEEPKSNVIILLLGQSKDNLIETIRSRVQVVKLENSNSSFMNVAVSRGLMFKSLGIFEEIHISVDLAEELKEVADNWVESIKDVLESSKLHAMQKVQLWETQFKNREQRNICLKLIQSYVNALYAEAKGTYHLWGNVPKYEWSELLKWGRAVDELSRSFYSNGHFTLQIESFTKKVCKNVGI